MLGFELLVNGAVDLTVAVVVVFVAVEVGLVVGDDTVTEGFVVGVTELLVKVKLPAEAIPFQIFWLLATDKTSEPSDTFEQAFGPLTKVMLELPAASTLKVIVVTT
jgi:hypothetical protein